MFTSSGPATWILAIDLIQRHTLMTGLQTDITLPIGLHNITLLTILSLLGWGGTNYAVGGARSSDVLSQTNQIVSDHGTLDSNALYLAMPGVWDVLDTFNNQTPSPYQQAIDTALGNINSAFTNLVNNGARNFLILNFIDAAQHPRYSSDTNASQLTTNIEIMNSGLADIAKQPVSRLSVA